MGEIHKVAPAKAVSTVVVAENRSMTLFNAPAGVNLNDEKRFKRRNMPQLIKPGEVPEGGIVSGEIIDVIDSPVTTVKGKLLWIKHDSGIEFTFPVTGVVKQALAPGKDGDDLTKQLKTEIGNIIVCKRLPSKQLASAKKETFLFDVFTSKK